MDRRRFIAGVAAAGLALPHIVRAQAPIPVTGGAIRVGLSELPSLWDPLGSRDFNTLWVSTLVYDTLLQFNGEGQFVPGLALFSSWSDDGTVLTLDLRDSARFSDGTPVKSFDVVQSLERARDRSWRLESVRFISALSDQTIQIVTESPDASLLASLASPEMAICPRGAPDFAEQVGTGIPPLGSGPFRILPLRQDAIRLLPNPWYWQVGRPRLGSIRITGMTEESTRSVALMTGEVDVLPDVPLLDVSLIRQEPSLKLVGSASTLGCMLILNMRQPPMSDVSFRLLFNRAIDRKALVKAATADEASPQHLLIHEDHWAALDNSMDSYDRDELKQDLRDLGYPVGLRLHMISDERNVSLSNAAVFLQDQLAFIGISLSVDLLPANLLRAALEANEYDLYASSIDAWRDPHELFRPLVMTDGDLNVGGYTSEHCDRLIRSGVLVEETERRAPYYQQLQRVLLQDVPVVVLYLQNYFDSMTSKLQNYPQYPPISGLGMRHAWLENPAG